MAVRRRPRTAKSPAVIILLLPLAETLHAPARRRETQFETCLAGMKADAQGVLSVMVEMVQGTPKGDEADLFVMANVSDGGNWVWGLEQVKAGDEIVIKLLPPGEFEEPSPLESYADDRND